MPNAITPTAARWPLLPPASAPSSVVAPRQVNYRFQYANGSLTNTGNATLRILAYGPCLKAADGKECKENYYLMPGKSRRFTRVDTADKKDGWRFGRVSSLFP